MGGSDLYSMASDFMTPLATTATDGMVMFVAGLNGAGDVTSITAGEVVFLKVIDPDQNYDSLSKQTVSVTITTGGGDTETISLVETGNDTGVFTGSILSAVGAPVAEGVPQVLESVTATYTDVVDASGAVSQVRTDVASVVLPNNAPVAVDDAVTTTQDTSVTISVRANDRDVDGDALTVAAVTQGSKGTVTIVGDTTVTYTPTADSSGTDTFTYTISDGQGGSATATVTVTVEVPLFPQLLLTKGVDNATAVPGDTLTYTTSYVNAGTDTATVVVISDNIPSNAVYVPNSVRVNGLSQTDEADGDATAVSDGVITVTIGVVPAGASGEVQFLVRIP